MKAVIFPFICVVPIETAGHNERLPASVWAGHSYFRKTHFIEQNRVQRKMIHQCFWSIFSEETEFTCVYF